MVASSASAATLNVSGGQLLGAFAVDVGGNLYDVEFVDGTCIALFDGCDEPSDFVFTTEAGAIDASQALLDQVFVDGISGLFDSQPDLTAGCDAGVTNCFAYTVFVTDGVSWIGKSAMNRTTTDFVQEATVGTSDDFTALTVDTFAVWTPVPEPGTALLMGLGLLALGVRTRREALGSN